MRKNIRYPCGANARLYRRQGQMTVKPPNPKYIAKPYEQMRYLGQRVQIDVKFVPEACIVGEAKGQKFYQYTAIDEYSRFRYLEAFEEHGAYSFCGISGAFN